MTPLAPDDSNSDHEWESPELQDFMEAWLIAPDKEICLNAYCQNHPNLAEEFKEYHKLQLTLLSSPPQSAQPLPSMLGEFLLIRRVAEGGMSDVFLANQKSLNRQVVIKRMKPCLDQERFQRFLHEVQIQAALQHGSIAYVIDRGETEGIPYFAMAYVDGAPLSRILDTAWRRQQELPGQSYQLAKLVEETLFDVSRNGRESHSRTDSTGSSKPVSAFSVNTSRIRHSFDYMVSFAQTMKLVAEAVQFAHDKGIIHRDLKPSNIIVDRTGHPLLIDFGLAGPPVESGARCGTKQYMAPEQWLGQSNAQSDVWALGCILYESLSLRRPFPTSSERADPMQLNDLITGVPADLCAICQKAIQREPGNRYSTAQQLADDLGRWLKGEPVRANPPSSPRRFKM
ncbi:MAG TPA: serine/threonine-protein kinase, partial [Gemmata sp.]|nr:serine/threonine-protein kinase [Gemmata sp.]